MNIAIHFFVNPRDWFDIPSIKYYSIDCFDSWSLKFFLIGFSLTKQAEPFNPDEDES